MQDERPNPIVGDYSHEESLVLGLGFLAVCAVLLLLYVLRERFAVRRVVRRRLGTDRPRVDPEGIDAPESLEGTLRLEVAEVKFAAGAAMFRARGYFNGFALRCAAHGDGARIAFGAGEYSGLDAFVDACVLCEDRVLIDVDEATFERVGLDRVEALLNGCTYDLEGLRRVLRDEVCTGTDAFVDRTA